MQQSNIRLRDLNGGRWFAVHKKLFSLDYPKRRKAILIAVYSALSAHTDKSLFKSWPSQERIALITGTSLRSVKTVIKDLLVMRVIRVERTTRNNKTRNTYYLTHPTEWLSGLPPRALRSVHRVHPNKTVVNEIYKLTRDLVAQKQL